MSTAQPVNHISRFYTLLTSLLFLARCCIAANGRPKELQRRNILLQKSEYVTSTKKAYPYKSMAYVPWHSRRSYVCYNINRVALSRPGRIGQRVRAHYVPRPENNALQALCEVNWALRGGSGVGPAGLSYMAHRWFGMPRHAEPASKGCCSTLLRGSVLRGGGKPIRSTLQERASRDKRQCAGGECANMGLRAPGRQTGLGGSSLQWRPGGRRF